MSVGRFAKVADLLSFACFGATILRGVDLLSRFAGSAVGLFAATALAKGSTRDS